MDTQQTSAYYQQNASARLYVLINICISAFLTPLTTSATIVAIPDIILDLNTNAVMASWILAIFQLSNMIALLPAGRLADRFGRKRIYLSGFILFSITTLMAGTASSIELLIFYRMLQGIGAAMFVSSGLAIISSVYGQHGRGSALGWIVSSVYLGLTLGPVIGGWLTEHYGWHAVFYFQVPLAIFSILLSLAKLKGDWRNTEVINLDYRGLLLFSIWLISLFSGISNITELRGFLLLLVSVITLLLFIYHSNRVSNPLVNLGLVVKNRNFTRSLLASLCMYSGFVGLLFLLSMYLQYSRQMSPSESGQLIMVMALIIAVCAPIVGNLSDRYRPRKLATMGCIVISLGYAVLLFVDQNSPVLHITIGLIVIGLGFGLFSTPNNNSAMGSVLESKLGIASALLNLSRLIGQMLGIAFVTFLISNLIGNVQIQSVQFNKLNSVWHWSLLLFLIFAISGAFFSHSKTEEKHEKTP